MQVNVQLQHVVNDTGAMGLSILRVIVGGVRDPKKLTSLRDRRCKSSQETARVALTGNYRPEHVFALRQALEPYDTYQAKIASRADEIEKVLRSGPHSLDSSVASLRWNLGC